MELKELFAFHAGVPLQNSQRATGLYGIGTKSTPKRQQSPRCWIFL